MSEEKENLFQGLPLFRIKYVHATFADTRVQPWTWLYCPRLQHSLDTSCQLRFVICARNGILYIEEYLARLFLYKITCND